MVSNELVVVKAGTAVPWTDLDVRTSPPGGEALSNVQTRVLGIVSEIEERFPSGLIVIVTHVGPIKSVLCSAMGAPLDVARHFFLDTGTISVVDWKPRYLVRMVNSSAHALWNTEIGS
jgi:probable phosphoglycerate mutase